MIPVEVIQTAWRFTTSADALDHWQSLAAGLVALLAALIAVFAAELSARSAKKCEPYAPRSQARYVSTSIF